MKKLNIKGAIPPMITPFKENGAVDFDGHAMNMDLWNKTTLGGYLVLGSNSETAYLNEKEKIELISITVKHAKQGRTILAGTGMESAQETIALTGKAADLGVDAALVLTPSFYSGKMNDEALISFFTKVADSVPIPVLIYNVPKFTHVNISFNAVRELCKHPNILGMKDSTGDFSQLIKFKSIVPDDFCLIVGTASIWLPALTIGIRAGILALANCAPEACAEVQRLFEENKFNEANELYLRLHPVNAAVTETFGVPGLKYACDLRGYRGGHVRNPLLPIKNEDKPRMLDIMQKAGLI